MSRRALGVLPYSNPDGGSGYIANPSLPWLSTFDITQLSPVYDQDTAWLRDSGPGSFSYYPQFDSPVPSPEPSDTACGVSGMGDMVLRRADVVAPLPSITGASRSGCVPVDPCVAELPLASGVSVNTDTGVVTVTSPIEEAEPDYSWLWLLLALAAGAAMLGGGNDHSHRTKR